MKIQKFRNKRNTKNKFTPVNNLTRKVVSKHQWYKTNTQKKIKRHTRKIKGGENVKLFIAVEKNDVEGVKQALSRNYYLNTIWNVKPENKENKIKMGVNAEINEPNNALKQNAIHIAAGIKNVDIAKLLIEYGADVNARINSDNDKINGWTALHIAVYNNHFDMVSILLANGANPNIENASKQNPLMFASRSGFLPIAMLLVENDINIIDKQDHKGRTALHYAVYSNRTDIVQYLLKHNAKTDIKDDDWGFTPIHIASSLGLFDMVSILIEYPGYKSLDNEGRSILHQIGADILTAELDGSRYHDVITNCIKCCVLFIEVGIEINAKDNFGKTALHRICNRSIHSTDIAIFLIANGADIKAEDDSNMVPLDYPLLHINIDLVRFLTKYNEYKGPANEFIKEYNRKLNMQFENPLKLTIKEDKMNKMKLWSKDKKIKYLKDAVQNYNENIQKFADIEININHNNMFEDSFKQMYRDIKNSEKRFLDIHVSFKRQQGEGIDVLRDYFSNVGKDIIDPDRNLSLFIPVTNSNLQGYISYQPNPDYGYISIPIVQKDENISVPAENETKKQTVFSRYPLKMASKVISHIITSARTEVKSNKKELLDYSPNKLHEFYRDRYRFLGMIVGRAIFGGFTMDDLVFNKQFMKNIIGEPIADTDSSIKPHIESFLQGLYSIIPQDFLKLFTIEELEIMISGEKKTDQKEK